MRPARFVAGRHLYECAGGFCATIPFAAPWEAFQRLVHAAGVPPVPVPMAAPDPAPSPAHHGYGEEVRQRLAAVDLVAEMASLAPSEITVLQDACARQAAALVQDDVEHGRFASALATIAEALRVPVSPSAHEHLTAALVATLR
jgi:hypothetical protein